MGVLFRFDQVHGHLTNSITGACAPSQRLLRIPSPTAIRCMIMPMRIFLSLAAAASLAALALLAQQPGGDDKQKAKGPKNLKILAPDNFRPSMDVFTQALGVQCTYCHVQGQMDSDD